MDDAKIETPAWLKKHKELIAENLSAVEEESRKKFRKRRVLSQACKDVECPHLASIFAGIDKRPGRELKVRFCYRRDCPREKADDSP